MAEEFQGGICSANWWNSARNIPTPCSTTLIDVGSLEWSNEMEMKARPHSDSVSVSCNPMVFQDIQSLQESDSIGGGDSVLTDSTLQMVGYSLSSQTTEWNQTLGRSTGRSSELKLSSMLQEDLSSKSNFQQQFGLDPSHGHNEWSPKNYSDDSEGSSRNPFKQINQVFSLEQHDLDPTKNSDDSTVTSQGFPCMNYPTITASTLLPGLYELDPQSQQRPYLAMNYASPVNSPTFSNQFLKTSPPKRQSDTNQLHFFNNTPFLNASSNAMNDARSSLSVSTQPQPQTSPFNEKGSNCSNFPGKFNSAEVQDSCSLVKKTSEPTFKRPRIETPSPLPTFKVRKEKLGDRITALQQLVSPFGKTDTASVLFEAIEYIKFLHEKVGVLSSLYMKNGVPTQYQQNSHISNDSEGLKENLKSRGLCLVPISSTFPVINETTADFWTSTFGGSYM